MRIGIVTGEYPPAIGGVGDHAARLASELVAVGHTVHIVTSTPPSGFVEAETDPLAPRAFRIVPRWDWRMLPTVSRLARRQSWDVLHIQYQSGAYQVHPAINLLPRWVRRTRDAPAVVTTFHDLRVPYILPKAGPLRRLAVRELARASHGVIAVADEDLPDLLGWTSTIARPPMVEHIPLGHQMDDTPPPDFDVRIWRVGVGVAPDAALLGHFGFVNHSKGVDDLVRALAILVDAGRDVHLLMIGESLGTSDPTNRGMMGEVERLIAEHHLQNRVHWTGHQAASHVAGWLRTVDLAVLPYRDGASLRRTSLITAWAHGVAVLTTSPSRPVEWLRGDHPAAEGVPSVRPETLAIAIGGLLDSPTRRASLAAGGVTYAARFHWPDVARRTVEVYRQARRISQR